MEVRYIILVLLLLVGCTMEYTSFSPEHRVVRRDLCLEHGLNLDAVGADSSHYYCHCAKIIQVPK